MDIARLEKISKALSDKTRLRIFQAIAQGQETNCGDLVSLHGVTPATVSHHLKVLSEAGLIECQRQGQFVHSRAVPEVLGEYTQAVAKLSSPAKPRKRTKKR